MASAFVDNIPLTTMMVKITISLAQNSTLNLPLQPLVWALALGACLGGECKELIATFLRVPKHSINLIYLFQEMAH